MKALDYVVFTRRGQILAGAAEVVLIVASFLLFRTARHLRITDTP